MVTENEKDKCLNLQSRDLYMMIKDRLKKEGYEGLDNIRFSLSYCQGDGIAFYGSVRKNIKDDLISAELPYIGSFINYAENYLSRNSGYWIQDRKFRECEVYFKVKKDMNFHLYNHANTMKVSADFHDLFDFVNEVCNHIIWKIDNRNTDLEKELIKLLDCKTETKEIIEQLEGCDDLVEELYNYFESGIKKDGKIYYDKQSKIAYYLEIKLSDLSKELEKEAYRMLENKVKEGEIYYDIEEGADIEVLKIIDYDNVKVKEIDSQEVKVIDKDRLEY
ncbi:MAG: hypothetical protein ACOCRK_11910 [bacterium]